MTIISLYNSLDCVLASIKLKDQDATGEAMAAAAIELIEQTGSLNQGDIIKIEEV
jgi:hypothetical protein